MNGLTYPLMLRPFLIVTSFILLVGCSGQQINRYAAFETAQPKSILILPPLNASTHPEAGLYLSVTLPRPIANRGYYPFPVHTVRTVLKQEGLTEAGEIHQVAPERLAHTFGADAILYPKITTWAVQYAVLESYVTVGIAYRIVDAQGQLLWEVEKVIQQPIGQSNGNHGLLGALISAAIAKAIADDKDLLKAATSINTDVFQTGVTQLPLRHQ